MPDPDRPARQPPIRDCMVIYIQLLNGNPAHQSIPSWLHNQVYDYMPKSNRKLTIETGSIYAGFPASFQSLPLSYSIRQMPMPSFYNPDKNSRPDLYSFYRSLPLPHIHGSHNN